MYIYEVLQGDTVVNRVVADESFMKANFSKYRLAEDHLTFIAFQAREKRNAILKFEVDPLANNALRWNDLSLDKQQAWADYRRALLDLPEQVGFPENIVWPIKPE